MLRKLYNYYFSPQKAFVRALTKALGFIPNYMPFYERAFMHRASDEKSEEKYEINNERLEFLGDAVLDTVAAEFLFKKYPTQDEGFLTQMRSKLVNRKILNRIAEQMNFDLYMRQFGATNVSTMMLGNALEAFIGAVYLDVGYEKTRKFLYLMFRRHVDIHELENLNDNYKSSLLEHCQRKHQKVEYEVVRKFRAGGNRERFQVCVTINGEQAAVGEDYSKKGAEQIAAHKALIKLGAIPPDSPAPQSE